MKNILTHSSDNCGHFSLLLQQNFTSNSFWKAGSWVDSETISINLLCYIKIHWSILYRIQKSHLLIWLWTSPEKSCKYWEAVKLTEVDKSFAKFLLLLESSNFISGDKHCRLLSLAWRAGSWQPFATGTPGSRCGTIHKEHSWHDCFLLACLPVSACRPEGAKASAVLPYCSWTTRVHTSRGQKANNAAMS